MFVSTAISRCLRRPTCFAGTLAAALLVTASCTDSRAGAATVGGDAPGASSPLTDAPIAARQGELLDLAFRSATAMPVRPHIKDRSRIQALVVTTCLELDQLRRASEFIPSIGNWRRGAAWADLAFRLAQDGDTGSVQPFLDQAREVAELPEDAISEVESPQGWRRDRIRARIAKTHVFLGDPEAAASFETGLEALEQGEVDAARVMRTDPAQLDAQVLALDQLVVVGNFEQVQARTAVAVELFDRCYDDVERRSRVEAALLAACAKLPPQFCIETVVKLAELALGHEDAAKALELVDVAQSYVEASKWDLDSGMPLLSAVIGLRHRAGDAPGARSDADAALARFDAQKGGLSTIRQARALRPLAEAYQTLGEAAAALELYRRVVELGAENPNARPRAEELVATCCSMARHGVEPGSELWARMHRIAEGLVDPW